MASKTEGSLPSDAQSRSRAHENPRTTAEPPDDSDPDSDPDALDPYHNTFCDTTAALLWYSKRERS